MDSESSASPGKLVVSFHFKFDELKTGRRWKRDPELSVKSREWGTLEEVGVLRSSVTLMMLEFECEMSPQAT